MSRVTKGDINHPSRLFLQPDTLFNTADNLVNSHLISTLLLCGDEAKTGDLTVFIRPPADLLHQSPKKISSRDTALNLSDCCFIKCSFTVILAGDLIQTYVLRGFWCHFLVQLYLLYSDVGKMVSLPSVYFTYRRAGTHMCR